MFIHFLSSNKLPGHKSLNFLVGILGETMTSKIYSEFNWPLPGGSFHENWTKLKIPFGTYPPLLFCDFFCRRSVTLAVNPWDLPRNFSTRLLFYNQFYCCLDTLIFFKFSQGLQFSFVEHISRFFLLRQIWIVNYCVKNPVKNYQ